MNKEDLKPRKKYKVILSDMIFVGTYTQVQKKFTDEDIKKLLKENRIVEF